MGGDNWSAAIGVDAQGRPRGGVKWETPPTARPPTKQDEVDVTQNLYKLADDPRQKAHVEELVQEMIDQWRRARDEKKPRS